MRRHLGSTIWKVVAVAGIAAVTITTAGSAQALPSPGPAIAPARSCAALSTIDLTQLAGAPSVVASAADATMNNATYCVVTGYSNPQEQFKILLPETTWQGDYLQEGCGGLCGAVPASATPQTATGCTPVTGNQFVLAGDDSGHEDPSPFDGTWAIDNLPARINYGYLSEHQLRIVANAVITSFYGRAPRLAYYDGCSDGGREAVDLAERYPTDFNGILAGSPASDFGALMESMAWDTLVNTDSRGDLILTTDKLPALHAAVMRACADADGVIEDPRACTFDPVTLQCPAGTDTASCLTPAQVTVARQDYLGPHDAAGHEFLSGGLPYGSELAWDGWSTLSAGSSARLGDYQFARSYLSDMAFPDSSPDFRLSDWKFDVAHYERIERYSGLYDATSPDLSAFQRVGGKLLLYTGWSDQLIPPFSQLDYYGAVERQAGGFAASQEFSRLYLVPGGYHCLFNYLSTDTGGAGGDPAVSPDLLTPLISWVRDGQAPAALTLPVTSQTTGAPVKSLTVRPFDALTPAPRNNGLNSNYHYYGATQVYRAQHLTTCTYDNGNYRCTSST